MRDQLDRFGEIDATAKLLHPVLASATEARIVNRDDPLLLPLGRRSTSPRTQLIISVWPQRCKPLPHRR